MKTARDMAAFLHVFTRLKVPGTVIPQVEFREALEANFRLLTAEEVGGRLNVTAGEAKALIGRLSRRVEAYYVPDMVKVPGGRLPQKERELLWLLLNTLVIKGLFTEQGIADDFRHVLLAEKIIEPDDAVKLDPLTTKLALYAISAIHGSVVRIQSHPDLDLVAGTTHGAITVVALLTLPINPQMRLGLTFFTTNIDAAAHTSDLPLNGKSWDGPIEMRDDGRLYPLR